MHILLAVKFHLLHYIFDLNHHTHTHTHTAVVWQSYKWSELDCVTVYRDYIKNIFHLTNKKSNSCVINCSTAQSSSLHHRRRLVWPGANMTDSTIDHLSPPSTLIMFCQKNVRTRCEIPRKPEGGILESTTQRHSLHNEMNPGDTCCCVIDPPLPLQSKHGRTTSCCGSTVCFRLDFTSIGEQDNKTFIQMTELQIIPVMIRSSCPRIVPLTEPWQLNTA